MTNQIGQALVSATSDIISLILAEDETTAYPYAVYDLTSREYADKDGRVYRIAGDVALDVVSKDFAEADSKATAIKAALASLGEGFKAGPVGQTKDCIEGIWIVQLQFTIVQFNDITNS